MESEKAILMRLAKVGISYSMAIRVIALWLFLQSLGLLNIIEKMLSQEDNVFSLLSDEAQAILAHLYDNPNSTLAIPHTEKISTSSFSVHEKLTDRKNVTEAINEICNTLFTKLSKTIVWEENKGESEGRSRQHDDEGSSQAQAGSTETMIHSKLNPGAKEWRPPTQNAPEEDRCLFLTFSNGFPLSYAQIQSYFLRKFGPCIETIYVHPQQSRDQPPLFGKITFNSSVVPNLVLEGGEAKKLMVDGRPLWCKKYIPKTRRSHSGAPA